MKFLNFEYIEKYFRGESVEEIVTQLKKGVNSWKELERSFCKNKLELVTKGSPLA